MIPGHFNYYSFISVIVVAVLSFRVWKSLFNKKLLSYVFFVLIILLINSQLSSLSWFFDFELNGAKHSILLLLLFELIMTKNEDFKKLYFIAFIACNPLISSWFVSLILFSFLASYLFLRESAEFKHYFTYVKQSVLLLIVFWVLFFIRASIFKASVPNMPGFVPYDLVIPTCFKCIFSDVLFFYRDNLQELYLRLIILVFVLLHMLLKFQDRRISISLLFYLFIDFVQAGYFGYKFFEFQQFTAIPLSFITFFLIGDLLLLKEFSSAYDMSILFVRKYASKLISVS